MAAQIAPADTTTHLRSVDPTTAPELTVVPRRRRWPILVGGFFVLLLLGAMLGAAVFHTQLAERQLEIDALGDQVQAERDRYAELRNEIAVKSNPTTLEAAARSLGLTRAPNPRFLEADGWSLAVQYALAGPLDDNPAMVIADADPLEQFQEIKSLSAGQP